MEGRQQRTPPEEIIVFPVESDRHTRTGEGRRPKELATIGRGGF